MALMMSERKPKTGFTLFFLHLYAWRWIAPSTAFRLTFQPESNKARCPGNSVTLSIMVVTIGTLDVVENGSVHHLTSIKMKGL